ncbi:MAG: Oligopeptide-binding protein OppA [Chlamydiia bacterium]|nr:Oligopeptide-binding protein OppA [Chlamydiia bacterium]MCH9618308.1 Oligopeptide-binding protein OppA [Chlamydiia bacterium]MCH9624181.1 Oligopeptide-binding protein OppA [Chlamydiia bacterium]
MFYSKRFISGSLLLSLFFFSSCGRKGDSKVLHKSTQEITVNISSEPATLDPRKARLLADFNVIRALNDGLFRANKEGITSPAIAKSYTVSEDGKTYTIQLREALWSNGDPVTAHDFIASWKSSLDKDFPSPGASFLFAIKNGEQLKEGLLPASMLGAVADGDYKIIIELEKPLPYFVELLSMPIYFPIHQDSENKEYVGNGPFTIESWAHNDQLVIKKNANYWDRDNVKMETVNMVMVDENTAFNMYQNKALHLVGSPFSKIPSDAITHLRGTDSLKTDPFLGTYWIRTNVNAFPLSNKNFRKSLASSINRKDIVEHVLSGNGEVATGIVPTSFSLQDAPYFQDGAVDVALNSYNKACQELSLSKKNMPSITFTFVGNADNNRIAAALQDGWKKTLGINVLLEPLEYKVYIEKIRSGDYQLAWGSWIADFKDPINFLEVFKTKSVGTNNTGWESPDYISAINETYESKDVPSREKSLIRAETLLLDEMPVIPVYHTTMLHMQNEHLKDIVLTETGNLDFKWAYLSDK